MEGRWRWIGVRLGVREGVDVGGGEVSAVGGRSCAVGESGGLLHGLLDAFFGWDGGVVFVFAGCDGLEGGGVVVVCEVAAAHDVGRPDEREGVEGDVGFCFPGVDALA